MINLDNVEEAEQVEQLAHQQAIAPDVYDDESERRSKGDEVGSDDGDLKKVSSAVATETKDV